MSVLPLDSQDLYGGSEDAKKSQGMCLYTFNGVRIYYTVLIDYALLPIHRILLIWRSNYMMSIEKHCFYL